MEGVDYSVISWEWLPLFCKWFLLYQHQIWRKSRWSFSLFLSRTTSQWEVNTHTFNLSTWTNFVSRKGWPKNFKATGKTNYYNRYSWHCPFLFRLDLLMVVVSYVLWMPIKTMQLDHLMQNFLSIMTSQGAFYLILKYCNWSCHFRFKSLHCYLHPNASICNSWLESSWLYYLNGLF